LWRIQCPFDEGNLEIITNDSASVTLVCPSLLLSPIRWYNDENRANFSRSVRRLIAQERKERSDFLGSIKMKHLLHWSHLGGMSCCAIE